jgi:hypothetical protein
MLDIPGLYVSGLEEVVYQDTHFIRGDIRLRSDTPVPEDPLLIRNSQNDVRIANVHTKQHNIFASR